MKHLTNKQIEDKAIEYILKKERNLKRAKFGAGYDLYSRNKVVEVKGTSSNLAKQRIVLSGNKEYNAYKNKREKYFLYRVINVGKKNIKIIIYKTDQIELKPEPRWNVRIK